MRLATVRTTTGTCAARVDEDGMALLPYDDLRSLIASGADWLDRAAATGQPAGTDRAKFAPVVPHPEKIICVGANFRSHVEEVGLQVGDHPSLFAKFDRSLVGAHDPITVPTSSACVDWEVELGVVIGAEVRRARPEEALDAVAGYTIVNDISMRDWQLRTGQFLQGKTFEATTPVGPFLATPDEVDHALDLEMTCTVDGVQMQCASTADMIFSVAEVIAYVSTFITLVPGDLIAMGTPAGIGAIRQPPVYLTPGSEVRTAITGLGEQSNTCAADPAEIG